MCIDNLIEQRTKINNLIIKKINDDKNRLRELADNMAESATNMHGQGYGAFIVSRDLFLSELDNISKDYCKLHTK